MADASPPGDADPDQAAFIRLQAQYEDEMKDLTTKRRYASAAVLILYWDKLSLSHLDLRQEVEDLQKVFKEEYHFEVIKRSLNPISEENKAPKTLLQKYLADFVYDHDLKGSLLIIYYAGHGNPGERGELMLNGGGDPNVKVDQVVWNQSEHLIYTANADVFLIFDCCFAGMLCGTIQKRAFDTKLFEFLGATSSNGVARLPGPESFTSALIFALKKLSGEKDGFTTSRLQAKILDAPNFPKEEQTPVLSERSGHCLKRLVLAPLETKEEQPIEAAPDNSQDYGDSFRYSLSLQLLFSTIPTAKEMEAMCRGLKEMVRYEDLKAKHVIWRGMHPKGASRFELSPSVHAAAFHFLSPILSKRKRTISGDSKKNVPVVDKHPSSLQIPSPASSQNQPELAVEERVNDIEDSESHRAKRRNI